MSRVKRESILPPSPTSPSHSLASSRSLYNTTCTVFSLFLFSFFFLFFFCFLNPNPIEKHRAGKIETFYCSVVRMSREWNRTTVDANNFVQRHGDAYSADDLICLWYICAAWKIQSDINLEIRHRTRERDLFFSLDTEAVELNENFRFRRNPQRHTSFPLSSRRN